MTYASEFLGANEAANFVRLFIIFVGITLSLVALRISVNAFMRREMDKFWGTVSFALIIVTPAISGLLRFGEPLTWPSTIAYLAGLLAGIVAFGYKIALSPPWRRYRRNRRIRSTQRQAERAREDADRAAARKAEDDALTYDRKREDDLLGGGRDDQDDRDRRDAS